MQRILIFIYLLMLGGTFCTYGQIDREFWFAAPDVYADTGDDPVFLRVTTFGSSANVKIILPAENSRVLEQFSVGANSQFSLELNKTDIENTPSDKINSKGLYIVSDADISVYYEVSNENNAEKFILKGDNALGKEFFIPSQNIYQNNQTYNGLANEKADIVATEDNTNITVIPAIDISGHKANEPFNIVLNKGESYGLECKDNSNFASLSGTEIASDKRIAVTISDDAVIEDVESAVCDLIGDQLIPTSAIGTEYVAINTSKSPDSFKNTNSVQKVFVLAIEDNTLVFINNTTKNTKALQKGEVAEFDISDHSLFIYATKKVYAYQVTGLVNTDTSIANELGSAILPNYNCNGSRQVSFTRVFNRDFWVNIIVKRKDNKSFVLYDNQGKELNLKKYINSWQTVPGQDTGPDAWVCCAINMNELSTGNPYILENTSGVFHLCVLDENGEDDELGCVSFGYFSSYNSFWMDGSDMACKGDVIELTAKDGMKSYRWYSLESDSRVLSTDRTCLVQESGTYYVEAEVKEGGCFLSDTLNVVFTLPLVNLGNDTTVCQGEELFFEVDNDYYSYLWSNGDSDNQTSISTPTVGILDLSVEVTDEIGCINKDSVAITVNGVPEIQIDKTEVCEGTSIANTTEFAGYEWSYNGEKLNYNTSQNWITPEESGTYTLTAWNAEGCSVSESIEVTVYSQPTLVLEDLGACEGEVVTINGPDGFSNYLWSTGAVSKSIQLNTSADYWLEITDANGCKTKAEASLTYYKPATIDLGPDKEECAGVDIILSGDNSFSNYNWNFKSASNPGTIINLSSGSGNTYQILNAESSNNGVYMVEATDVNGCEVSDEVSVTTYLANPPELSLTENLCEGEVVDIIASEGYDTYTWYQDGTHISVSDNLNQLADVEASGIYRLEATLGACKKASEIQVVSHSLPSVQLPDDFTICMGEPKDLLVEDFNTSSGAALDYLFWNNNEDLRFSDWETAALEINQSGEYTVTVVDSYGCSASDQISVSAIIPEEFDLGLPQSFCDNTNVILENPVLGALDYKWYKLSASSEDLLIENSPLEVSQAGTYVLNVTDGNGCNVSDQVELNINPLPEINIAGDPVACGSTTLFAESTNQDLIHLWNGTSGLNSNQMIVSQSGTYNLQVWDENGCTAQDQLNVVINPLPSINIEDQSACEGDVITLVGPSGFMKYDWSTGETSQNIELTTNEICSLEVTDSNGCQAKDQANVSFVKPVSFDLGDDKEDCEGSSVTLVGDNLHHSWKWTFTPVSSDESEVLSNTTNTYEIMDATPEKSGIYQLDAIDLNGCPVTDEVMLTFYSVDLPMLSATENLCEGETIDILASSGYESYTWYLNGIEQPDYANLSQLSNISVAGTYRVEATLGVCVKNNEIEVVKHELPTIQLPDNLLLCNGVETILSVENYNSGGGTFDYLYWNDNENIRLGDWTSATLNIDSEGRYSVTAVDEFGCRASDFVDVFQQSNPDLLGNNTSICKDEVLTLAVNEGYSSYLWSNGDIDHETEVVADQVGEMTLGITVEDERGCITSDNINIQVNAIPSILLNTTEVCNGSSVTNMSDFVRYEWLFNGDIINTVESQNWIIPGVSGVYTITGWTADGCMVTKDVNITVHSLPEITLEEKTACAGTDVEINGPTGFNSYNWSTGETTQNIELSQACNYWVDVTDANGCVGRAEASLNYIEPMELDLGEDKSDCIGVSMQLEGNPDYTNYNWSFEPASHPGAFISLNPIDESVYILQDAKVINSGVYYVEATDLNGCAVTDEVSVDFYTAAPPELRATEDLCAGQEIELVASEGYDSYSWYNGATHLSSFDDQQILSGVNQAGLFKLEATIGTCLFTKEIEVVEHGLPSVSLSDKDKLCEGESLSISIDNYSSTDGTALSYLYWNDESDKRYSDWQSTKLNVNQAGNYSVTVIDNYGCVATDQINVVSVVAEPLDLGDPYRICMNDKVLLENPLNNVLNYQWYRIMAETNELLQNDGALEVSESGTYKLQIEDLNGCINEDEVDVNVMPLPDVEIYGDSEACETTRLVVAEEKYGYSYQWNGDANLISPSITATESGTYILDVWDEYGCHNSNDIDVVIYDIPNLAMENDTVCAGETSTLTGPQGDGLEYLWSTGQKTSSVTVSKGDYALWITDKYGCTAKADVSVVWRDVPKVDLGSDMIICPLENWSLDAGSAFSSYLWHDGSTSEMIIADLLDTVNTVVVTDQYGCSGFDSQTVKYKQIPELELCSDTSVCKTSMFVLDIGGGFSSYLWNDGDDNSYKEISEQGEYSVEVSDGCFIYRDTAQIVFFDEPIIALVDSSVYGQVSVYAENGTQPYLYSLDNSTPQEENVFKNLKNGIHEIYIMDANGCNTMVSIVLDEILDITIPPFFTPNSDGVNDLWEIDGINDLPDSIIKIYNRYGKLLAKYHGSDPGWNGYYQGQPVSTDDYWYVIELANTTKVLKGHITLKR